MPSLGINDIMQFQQRSTLLILLIRHMINPMLLTVIIESHHVVGINDLIQRVAIEGKACPDHGIVSQTYEDAITGSEG